MFFRRMIVGLMVAAGIARAADDSGWIIWDRDLNLTRGRLVSLGESGVQIEDRDGVRHVLTKDRIAALVDADPQHWTVESGSLSDLRVGSGVPVALELTDGQRWMGQWLESEAEAAEVLRVRIVRVGEIEIPLDLVASLAFREREGVRPTRLPDVDVVHLVNGDRLLGTVIGIGREVEIESEGSVVSVLRSSVAEIAFSNPASQGPPMRVWLSGSRVFGAAAMTGSGLSDVAIQAVGPKWGRQEASAIGAVRLWEPERDSVVVGIEFVPAQLVAWSALPIASVVPEAGRRWTREAERVGPSKLGSQSLWFSGPMAVTWRLPPHGQRASGVFSLGEGAGEWADCVVRVEQDGNVRWESRLRPSEPSAAFSIDLAGEREITVRVVSGAFGPIQNEVELRWGWVLVPSADESVGRTFPRR